MKLPKNMTEEEVLKTIEHIANKLCYKFKFGYHGVEDMKQQATLFALEGLEAYDEKRPLEIDSLITKETTLKDLISPVLLVLSMTPLGLSLTMSARNFQIRLSAILSPVGLIEIAARRVSCLQLKCLI